MLAGKSEDLFILHPSFVQVASEMKGGLTLQEWKVDIAAFFVE